MDFYVYILRSIRTGRFYIGHTNNLSSRVSRHDAGEISSTKAYRPWKFVYKEHFESRGEAMHREYELKSWKKISRLEQLIKSAAG